MKNQKFIAFLLVMTLFFTIQAPAFAAIGSNNVVSPNEFNQWQRVVSEGQFDVSDRIHAENIANNIMISCVAGGIAKLFGPVGALAGTAVGAFIGEVASVCVNDYYSEFDDTAYVTTVVGRFGSKLRIGIYVYSDSERTNLVYSDIYATDHYPL